GVVGCDHRPGAVAFDEGPVVAGLEVVVVLAEWVELVDPGAFGARPFVAVVVLEPARARTTEHGARRGPPPQRDLLRHGRGTSEMGDVGKPREVAPVAIATTSLGVLPR